MVNKTLPVKNDGTGKYKMNMINIIFLLVILSLYVLLIYKFVPNKTIYVTNYT